MKSSSFIEVISFKERRNPFREHVEIVYGSCEMFTPLVMYCRHSLLPL